MSAQDDKLREIKNQHKVDLEFERTEARFGIVTGFLVGLLIGIIVTKVFF